MRSISAIFIKFFLWNQWNCDIMRTSSRLLPLGLPEVKGLQLSPGHPWPAAGQHHQGDCPDHPVMVRGAMLEMKTRAQKCIDANGGHFEKKRGAVTIVCHIEVAETSWLKSKLNLFKIYVTPEFSPPFRWLNTIPKRICKECCYCISHQLEQYLLGLASAKASFFWDTLYL